MQPPIPIDHLLLIDIETVPVYVHFGQLPPALQELWLEKFTKIAPDLQDAEAGFAERAGIYAEFGKIVCISIGYFFHESGRQKIKLKSYYDHDEKKLLEDFLAAVAQFSGRSGQLYFCGHNVREFDIPYLCRRSVIHQLQVPPVLQLNGKKPWEVPMIDTLHWWRFGDYKHYTSLKLLAAVLGIPTPKDDIDGGMVGEVYWKEQDLPRIAHYCQKDVATVAQLVLRFNRMPLLEEEDIIIVS